MASQKREWGAVVGVLLWTFVLLAGCERREALLVTPLEPEERLAWRATQRDASFLARSVHEEALWLVGEAYGRAHCRSAHAYGTPQEQQMLNGGDDNVDGEEVTPTATQTRRRSPKRTASGPPRSAINPNTASRSQLQRLPRVGPATALAIIEGRPYASVDELRRIKGIGPSTLEAMRPYLEIP